MTTKKTPTTEQPPVLKPAGLTKRLSRNGNEIESYIGDPTKMSEQFVRATDIKPRKSNDVRRLVFGGPMSGGRAGGVR